MNINSLKRFTELENIDIMAEMDVINFPDIDIDEIADLPDIDEPDPEPEKKPYAKAPLPAKPMVSESGPNPLSGENSVNPAGKPPGKGPEKLLLGVVAVEDTWMKVVIDDRASREYSLKPGESLALEATSTLNLLIGNAGGVQLKLNGKPLDKTGKSG